MEEFHVNNFAELHAVLSRYGRNGRWKFRGHSNLDWKLVPKVGRPPFIGTDDRDMFKKWKRWAIEYIAIHPKDDWGWLAMVQHHGLATRLLDWTINPLVAAFFAVYESAPSHAVIFSHYSTHSISTDSMHPMDVPGVLVYVPMGVVPRIIRQGGLFTIHGEPSSPMETLLLPNDRLEKIVIDRSYRDELVFELSYYGINRASLFPDLDGLSDYTNWVAANRTRWELSNDTALSNNGMHPTPFQRASHES